MNATRLIFIGGFLGAGKTTLLWKSAQHFMKEGKKTGLITNDQAPDLVDTKILQQKGLNVQEVVECFCCNFGGLMKAVENSRNEADADVIIAEPVGSCADLSATLMQPLKENYRKELLLSPLTVLADPLRLEQVLSNENNNLHPDASYIYKKQLEEADLIVINKIDTLQEEKLHQIEELVKSHFPGAPVFAISSTTGAGMEGWLNYIMAKTRAGTRLAEVDYDTYAQGEAVLGWLNADIQLTAGCCCLPDWNYVISSFMKEFRKKLREISAQVGHIKVLLYSGEGTVVANLARLNEEISIRGKISEITTQADMIINARVEMEPGDLEFLVRDLVNQLNDHCAHAKIIRLKCINP
ncbi:MAG: GTP-binding protein, partial [Vulcanimicrobiota bacterium]